MAYPVWLPILLGFLTATGPLSTDMYLPAFPAIESSLGGLPGTAQITLAAWFAGLAVGQVTQGSLADRYGRRTPLIVGTLIYTAASAGCALAPDIWWLSAFRFIAAFGGSASMVIPRAMVRDLADGHAAARLMSRLMLVMGAAPILAPTLGGFVLTVASWHAIFWLTTAYGAICALLVWRALPDTLNPRHRVRLSLAGTLNRYIAVARDRGFMAFALTGGFGMFGMFAYIGGSSPVFINHFGFTPEQYGMLFGISALTYITASQINPRLVGRFGIPVILRVAVITATLGGLGMCIVAFTGLDRPAPIVVCIVVAMGSMGFVMPNAAVGALSRHATQAGTASALMGTIQFTLAAFSGIMVGAFTDGTPRPMAAMLLAGTGAALVADRLRPKLPAKAPETEPERENVP